MNTLLNIGGGLLANQGGFWLPQSASTSAAEVDSVFNAIMFIALFGFALIVGLIVIFVALYRHREGVKVEKSPSNNVPLQVAWAVIPLVLVIGIFTIGFQAFMDLRIPPRTAYEVQVTGQSWKWAFTYPNGHVAESLHVPAGRPVKLVLTSEDVIHSFFVPDFRMKMDAVPGRQSHAWFTAREPGMHQAFCAEFCGVGHSDMLADIVVHTPEGFDRWMEGAADILAGLSPEEGGAKLYTSRGCGQCHSTDGTKLIAPSFKGLFGAQRDFTDGGSLAVDDAYIRESILDPQVKIVAGFEPVMPSFRDRFKDREIEAIIAYIKSLE